MKRRPRDLEVGTPPTISLTQIRLRHWTDVDTRLVLLQTQGYLKYITDLNKLQSSNSR